MACGSCYGARDGCCNTCGDVRDAYRQKNWAFHPASFDQCKGVQEALARDGAAFKEGCQLYGHLEARDLTPQWPWLPLPPFFLKKISN